MKKILLIAIGTIILASCGSTKKISSVNRYRYDIDYVKNAGDGLSVVKVWSYGKTAAIAEAECSINAVHGVIFKGYSGQGAAQPPIVKNINGYSDNQAFFDDFFKSGEYRRYISSSVDGSTETRKTQSGEYKVSATMTGNVKMLRKLLEQAGIVKSLSAGF